ncbi:hypothetical protein SFC76_02960 [Sphingomonas sp. CD22]|uniref:hypothetical protein n=1 Tax=Sphingomonas sp. CD22 TaxID=3100214 RepID=UPI002AE09E3A|nr:hypothetical protein [Sphingomonas sp. CD22]MEA1083208.1 hypothetical protein [Sphingomonas sp. CD22]
MRVVTEAGTIELGDVETAPTIGIIDRSRRVTDDYGVTTVVQRGFSRRMSVRLAVPFENVDAIQRQLADLRATSATWIGDDRFGSLTVRGFYKEFEVDHAVAPLSYCALTVEGLTGEEAFTDDGTDPAPAGMVSNLQVLQPITVTDAILTSTSVAQDDAVEWTAAGAYAIGQRVTRGATHRVFESLIARNAGNDPAATTGAWLDVGPTNRWAMFDQAIGSATLASAPIAVTLKPTSRVSGLAILDTNAATVRAQAPGYDRTQAVTDGSGSALFLDLFAAAGASITVTLTPLGKTAQARPWDDRASWADTDPWRDAIDGTASVPTPSWDDGSGWRDVKEWGDTATGDGTVSVGTLLLGALRPLGVTEGSATSGITDYSRRETDDFGEVAIVPRAWAKRMAAKAAIRTDAVDQVVGRIAAVRAIPSLWLGDAGVDSLIVYGFFKDFSVEVGESISKLTLSIEGFSEAVTAAPLTIPWENVSGPKPATDADKTGDETSKDTNAVGGVPAAQIIADAKSVKQRSDILENVTIPAVNSAVAAANALIKTAGLKADQALADLNGKLVSAGIALDAAIAGTEAKLAAAGVATDLAASRANARIDAAMTDLNAEAHRAQGKDELLDRRIDSLTVVTNKNDVEVRALIETERLVRTDDVRSIAQRIDSVVTDFTGRDTATNTRITTQVTALSAADKALGERIDTVTTEYKAADTATSTRITDSVAALSAADTAIGKRVDAIVTDVTTKDTATRAEISRVELASSTRDQALGQRIDTVTTDYKAADAATSTRITDSIAALSAADTAIGKRVDAIVTDVTTKDTATRAEISRVELASSTRDTALGQRIDTVTTDYKAADTATGTRITTEVAALSSADAAIGRRIDTIATDYLGRDAATNTRITTSVTALSDADTAIGQRIDSITTDYVSRDSKTNTRVDQANSAMSEADRALGIRVDTVSAALSTTNTDVRAEISRVERAAVDRDTALSQRSDTITASLNDARGRLSTVETAVTDGRFATAQRVAAVEAQVGADLSARIDERVTAVVDPKIGVVTQSVTDLRSAYNGTVATVQQQAGTLVDLAGKATAYVRLLADGGNGVARLSLWSDQFGGAWELIGNGRIGGDLFVDGSITSTKMGASSVQQAMFLSLPGSMSIPYG